MQSAPYANVFTTLRQQHFIAILLPLHAMCHCSAAVGSAADSRRTVCMAAVGSAADSRRTVCMAVVSNAADGRRTLSIQLIWA